MTKQICSQIVVRYEIQAVALLGGLTIRVERATVPFSDDCEECQTTYPGTSWYNTRSSELTSQYIVLRGWYIVSMR